MEKMNIGEAKAFNFVKEALVFIGFPDNIEISSFIGDEDKPMYMAKYERMVDGEAEKHIKILRIKDIVDLMTLSMTFNGYDIEGIDIRVRDDKIYYFVRANIVTYGDGPKKNKRRR